MNEIMLLEETAAAEEYVVDPMFNNTFLEKILLVIQKIIETVLSYIPMPIA